MAGKWPVWNEHSRHCVNFTIGEFSLVVKREEIMRRYPASREYAPTMVANGSRRHPLHSHYRRIHRNPDVDFDDLLEGGGAVSSPVEVISAEEVAVVPAAGGKRGRKPMSASAKARAKADREARAAAAPASKSKKKVSASKAAENAILEAVRKAIAKATGSAGAGKAVHVRAPTLKIQYVGGHSASSKSASAKKAASADKREYKISASNAAKRAEALKAYRALSPSAKQARKEAKARGEKLPALVANPFHRMYANGKLSPSKLEARRAAAAAAGKSLGRPKMSESAKARAKAAREAGGGKKSASSKSASSRNYGPYKISLLKNPVTDFEIGGVKVVPALAGAAGTVALSQLIRNLPFVANMQPGLVKDLLPAAITVAAGAAGLYYAEKNSGSGMLKDLSKDIVVYGMFVGLNDVVGSKIRDMVDNLKAKPAATLPAAAATTSGGAFFNGGGWVEAPMPQLEGYHMSGGESGYPPAFALTGGEGYFVPSGLALNGYHMAGDANSAATAAAITALNGGAFREQAIGGIDLSGYQD